MEPLEKQQISTSDEKALRAPLLSLQILVKPNASIPKIHDKIVYFINGADFFIG